MNERGVCASWRSPRSAAFELDAELTEDGAARAFFVWTGGLHGFEKLFNEEPEPRICHGPFSLVRSLGEVAAPETRAALLVVRHPAARATIKTTPEWLLGSGDIRQLFGVVAPP